MTIDWAAELPVVTLPDDAKWRENFCFTGYDKTRNCGFWIHMGRWPLDVKIWREQVLLMLPDGSHLVHRAWGWRPSGSGPAGALLDLVCIKPGHEWRLRYHGPVRRAFDEELLRGPLTEGQQILLDLDLVFRSDRDVWDMGAAAHGQNWGKSHIEQVGRVTGDIAWADTALQMDGMGWRDHSRGARDIIAQRRHLWMHGELSEGRAFAVTIVDQVPASDVPQFCQVIIWDGVRIIEARCINPPLLESPHDPPETYEMALESELGTIPISARITHSLPHSSSRSYEVFDGVAPGLGHVVAYEQSTILTIDGAEYEAHTERSHLLPAPPAKD